MQKSFKKHLINLKSSNRMLEDNIYIRVRYADTDQMGFVYYGNYASYYEIARVELFRNIDFTYRSLEEIGIGMPVLNMSTNFLGPAKYDEELRIHVKLPEMSNLKIKFSYEIFNENQELINTGATTLTFIDLKTGKPKRIPLIMKNKLVKYFE